MITVDNYEKVFLRPGQLIIAQKPTFVWTTLGSCLSVVFYNHRQRVSGMCHAQLPDRAASDEKCAGNCPVQCMQDSPATCDFRYVNCSIKHMLDQFAGMGIGNSELVVKVFGGANVIKIFDSRKSVGQRNTELALSMLEEKRLTVASQDTGGQLGRTIGLFSDTGKVLLKRSRNSYTQPIDPSLYGGSQSLNSLLAD